MTVNCSNDSPKSSAEILMRKTISDWARVETEKIFDRSKLLYNTNKYPKLSIDEIEMGETLGKGSFGIAYECKVAFGAGYFANTKTLSSRSIMTDCTDLDSSDDDMSQDDDCAIISNHCRRGGEQDDEEGSARYAIKMLHQDAVENPEMLIRGSIDMAVEARILSSIDHPNVVKIYASGKTPYEANYFIVMDRLHDTLKSRINKWGKMQKRISSFLGSKLYDSKGKNKRCLLEAKLRAAIDLSGAINHLHQNNIVYRDLKSDNVGFDFHDNIKLFDFGLAKEVHTEDRDANGLYKLTAMTGSPMYMAPEVAMGEAYSYSCDTYSFAILFWEMYACKTPFEYFSMTAIRERVWGDENARPKIKEYWPDAIKGLLELSWSRNQHTRPSLQGVYDILEQEYLRIR